MDLPAEKLEPAIEKSQPALVITPVDVAMVAIAVILALGLTAAAILERPLPVVLVAFFGQIVTYYFGRSART